MIASWKFSFTICWVATFVALLADEISEQAAVGSWIYFGSLVLLGISTAIALIAGCIATASLVSSRKRKPS